MKITFNYGKMKSTLILSEEEKSVEYLLKIGHTVCEMGLDFSVEMSPVGVNITISGMDFDDIKDFCFNLDVPKIEIEFINDEI